MQCTRLALAQYVRPEPRRPDALYRFPAWYLPICSAATRCDMVRPCGLRGEDRGRGAPALVAPMTGSMLDDPCPKESRLADRGLGWCCTLAALVVVISRAGVNVARCRLRPAPVTPMAPVEGSAKKGLLLLLLLLALLLLALLLLLLLLLMSSCDEHPLQAIRCDCNGAALQPLRTRHRFDGGRHALPSWIGSMAVAAGIQKDRGGSLCLRPLYVS